MNFSVYKYLVGLVLFCGMHVAKADHQLLDSAVKEVSTLEIQKLFSQSVTVRLQTSYDLYKTNTISLYSLRVYWERVYGGVSGSDELKEFFQTIDDIGDTHVCGDSSYSMPFPENVGKPGFSCGNGERS